MIDMNKNTVLAIAGVCGTAFISYCIYFDRKRRNDPDFRRKLKERRQKQQSETTTSGSSSTLPDLRDVEAVQKFFIEEVQRGEELLGQGNYQEAVEHLTNAVAVCGQPQQLLQILQQTLPQPVFAMLLERLPSISQKLSAANPNMPEKKAGDAPSSATITDVDDLE